jgi:hypothetical protein
LRAGDIHRAIQTFHTGSEVGPCLVYVLLGGKLGLYCLYKRLYSPFVIQQWELQQRIPLWSFLKSFACQKTQTRDLFIIHVAHFKMVVGN